MLRPYGHGGFRWFRPMTPARKHGISGIIADYRPAIVAFFRRRLRDSSEAEDAAQEVFARLSRQAETDRIENIERYIFTAAANHLRDRHRRARTRPVIENEGLADPAGRLVDPITPERNLLAREAYAATVAALQELPERPRMIFVLNRYEEMTGREIAQMLGISQRMVEKNISRVLAHLRERLP